MVPPFIVSWTWTGPHSVDATVPVTVEVEEDPDDPDEPDDPDDPDEPEEPVDPVVTLELLLEAGGLVAAEASVADVEVWYPKRSTTADRLLRNQRVMRFMRSPLEGLEMELVRG